MRESCSRFDLPPSYIKIKILYLNDTKTTFTHYLRVVPTVFDGFLPITFTSKNHAPGAAIGVTRSYQFIAHSHQYTLKAPGSGANGGAGDTGCVSWRQVRQLVSWRS